MKLAYDDLQSGKTEEAIREGINIRNYYPEYVGSNSNYELLAQAYLAKNDKTAAVESLEQYRDEGGTNTAALKQLAGLEQEVGKSDQAENTLKKLNYLYPEDEEIHRRLGKLLLASGDAKGAVREFQALLSLNPSDTAESHYLLATALNAAHRTDEAKDQVVLALEAAPGFKPAQQLLIQLSQP